MGRCVYAAPWFSRTVWGANKAPAAQMVPPVTRVTSGRDPIRASSLAQKSVLSKFWKLRCHNSWPLFVDNCMYFDAEKVTC